ncbi:right-handed parallel beta-helix repeat-containing protein [Marinicella sp. S1101]|uniref:right-handed parallel beta-helix repeat-containing protein n=1 Tax=Marinicella marina TaxID=2996016 RepID=UPI002260F190|nr:right-handed parallel beta-helix repeat-containing protein [Marinicella marina]MCX7553217.1 right-handed parallel beta-helix repeat-containing protein [Marinicella marina]MDJ1138949.1 right-handed parallel beta-helix repeat-containing protein [Marinicella marina]
MKLITLLFFLLLANHTVQADTFTVNTTSDGDVCNISTCTLRGAINAALQTTGEDIIEFNIPADAINENYFSGGSGQDAFQYWMIQPTSELPELLDILIDGSTAGSSTAGNPTIVLDGSLHPVEPLLSHGGLVLAGGGEVSGLAFINWSWAGITMTGADNAVFSSWFGLNLPYGLAGAPNYTGIYLKDTTGNNNVIGGAMNAIGNVLSGNSYSGIYGGSPALILGNLIGTDPSGSMVVPNENAGIFTESPSNLVIGLAISGLGNVISGNTITGIHITADVGNTSVSVQGNHIGTNAAGNQALGNGEGIYVAFTDDVSISNNVISGNNREGILAQSIASDPINRLLITNNKIGVGADGITPLSNTIGVFIDGSIQGAQIGGTADSANVIAHNQCGPIIGCGIAVRGNGSTRVAIRYNQLFSNENEGIDLEADRFTPNDPDDFDSGANRLQNFPEINTAQHDPDGNRINMNFWVDSHNGASDYPIIIDVYAADADGEEGQTWLASTTFSESQWLAGNPVSRTLFAAAPVAENDVIVTTATEAGGRTSEFSPGFTLAGQPDFSVACGNKNITTNSTLTCRIDCEAEAVNGWADEVGLSCDHPDSSCLFLPSDEITFNQVVVPFSVEINHSSTDPGIYLNEVLGTAETQGGDLDRAEVITIKQLADEDYLFVEGFDGIVCQ